MEKPTFNAKKKEQCNKKSHKGLCRWQKKSAKLDGRNRKYTDEEFVIIFVTDRQMKTRKNSDCFEIQYL
ncbi:UNVERIFIED_CONTAM: hypothetical protein NCL1_21007 [Trichonephila clavipes]